MDQYKNKKTLSSSLIHFLNGWLFVEMTAYEKKITFSVYYFYYGVVYFFDHV